MDLNAHPAIRIEPDGICIPGGLATLEQFREWARSDDFPERGRIDWLAGEIEVDMAPEDINTHSSAKTAIAGRLIALIDAAEDGLVFIDSTRLSAPDADLSAEPDIGVLFFATLEAGRARLIRKASREEGRFVEIEGAVDLVVECVSNSSERKDRKRLPRLYFEAGVREYWLVDARVDPPALIVHTRGPQGYVPVEPDSSGFAQSDVLRSNVRLVRGIERAGIVLYRLEVRRH